MPIDPDILEAAYGARDTARTGGNVDPEILSAALTEGDWADEVAETQQYKMYQHAQRELEGVPSAYLRTATRKIGATVAGLGARVLGQEETADKLHRLAGAYTQAHSEKIERELPWGVSHVMKAGTEITAQAPLVAGTLMTGAGAAGLIAQASVTSADAAYTVAKDTGKSKKEAAFHATAIGLIEGGVTAAFQMAGLGGTEKMLTKGFSKAATSGVKGAMSRLGIVMATEIPEEVSVNFAQSFVSWYDNVDPEAMNPEQLKASTGDVLLQTILTAAAYSAPGLAASGSAGKRQDAAAAKIVAKRAKIIEVADEGRAPTRSEWKELGFSRFTAPNAEQRQAMVEDMAAVVQEQDAAAAPTEAAPQQRGTEAQVDPEIAAAAQEAPLVAEIAPDVPTGEQQAVDATVVSPEQQVAVEGDPGLLEGQAMTDALGGEVAPQEKVTGIYKKIADEIRAGFDLPGLESQAPQTQVKWLGEAAKKRESDRYWIDNTIKDVMAKPRTLTKQEVAGFNLELAALNNEVSAQAERMNSDDPLEVADAETANDLAITRVDSLLAAAGAAGTEWGRSGVAMQMVLKEDFSLGRLMHLEKTAKGEPLTKEESAELKTLASRNAELEAKLEAAERDAQELIDLRELTKAVRSAKGNRHAAKRKAAATKRAKDSRATFRAATKNLMQFGSPDVKAFLKGESGAAKIPTEIIDISIEAVKAHIDLGFVTFSEFWAETKPHVGTFDNAKAAFAEAWDSVGVEVDQIEADDVNAIRNHASRMIEAVVTGGETNLKQVVADVQAEMQKVCDGFTVRQTIDAITRQGLYVVTRQQASKARLDLAEIKKQLRLQEKLTAIQQGKDPDAKGAGKPRVMSVEEVSLRKEIAEARDTSKVITERKATTVKNAKVSRLQKRLDAIQQGKDPGIRRGKIEDSPEAKKLQNAIKEAEAESKAIQDRKKVAAQDAKVSRLQKRLDAIQQGKDPGIRASAKSVPRSSDENNLRNQISAAEAASPVVRRRKENQKEKAYLRQLEQALANARDTLANVSKEDVGAKPEAQRTEEAKALQFEIARVRREVAGRRGQHIRDKRSSGKKTFDTVVESANLGRTIVTAVDLPLLRQGMFAMAAHPIRTGKAAVKIVTPGIIGVLSGKGFKKGLTAERAFQHNEDIKSRENYQQAKRGGLAITEVDAGVSKQEEVYVGHILKQFEDTSTVRGWLAEPLARSERAYTMILNEIRADMFDNMVATLGKGSTVTDAQAKVIANFANVMSGRGTLGAFENSAAGMAALFFAPRYVMSRIQLAIIEPAKLITGVGHEAGTRSLIIKEYGKAAAGLASFYAAIAMYFGAFGSEDDEFYIGMNPLSTDFGKVVIGNRRIDPMAGLSQTLVFITRLARNRKITAAGKITEMFRPGYAKTDAYELSANFLRSKLAPWLSTGVDYWTGENIVGDPITLLGIGKDEEGRENVSALASLVVPFTFNDIYDVYGEEGQAINALSTTLAMLGMSLQTYDVESKQKGVAPNPFWGQDEADWEE